MSIASEIIRLQQAKSDLASSIEAKGVTVPAPTTIDGYAALVDQIQTGSTPSLPYDAEVEYIGSTGTQVLDTGIAFTDNFTWEIKFDGGVRNSSILGGRSSSERTCCLFFYSDTSHDFTIPIAQSNGANTPFQLSDLSHGVHTIKTTIASNSGSVWVDGVQQYTNQSFSGTYISGVSCALFCSKYGDNDYREHTTTKIVYFKMWQGETLVRDFIPVRIGDTGYLYDKVSETFFGNVGTGSFVVGDDKRNVPYDSKIEWLGIRKGVYTDISDYVPTGLGINVDMVVDFISYDSGNYAGWFSARTDASYLSYRVIKGTANNKIVVNNANEDVSGPTFTYSFTANTTYHLHLGTAYLEITPSGGTRTAFTLNTNHTGTANTSGFWIGSKNASVGANLNVRSFTVRNYGTVVLDYIPVRVGQVGYMYDKVRNKLYGKGSSSTTDFVLGNDCV